MLILLALCWMRANHLSEAVQPREEAERDRERDGKDTALSTWGEKATLREPGLHFLFPGDEAFLVSAETPLGTAPTPGFSQRQVDS